MKNDSCLSKMSQDLVGIRDFERKEPIYFGRVYNLAKCLNRQTDFPTRRSKVSYFKHKSKLLLKNLNSFITIEFRPPY